MTNPEKCKVEGCDQAVAASLDGEALCRQHFISTCYTRLDYYDGIRKGPGLSATNTESVRRFIHECTRSADEMELAAQDLDNLDRAKLLHIIEILRRVFHLVRGARAFMDKTSHRFR